MGELVHQLGEGEAKTRTVRQRPYDEDRGGRCVVCWTAVPRPRFKLCSPRCARIRRAALEAWRRKHRQD
jgi:hypothetical protein